MNGAASSGVGGGPSGAAPGVGEARGTGQALPPGPGTAQPGTAWFLRGAGPAAVGVPDAIQRLRRMAARRAARLRRRLAAAHGVLRARWLRSLQLRVVSTTLVISAVVVTVLGFFLMQQITSDLLKNKEAQAYQVVQSGWDTAQNTPDVDARPNGSDAQGLMQLIESRVAARGPEADYAVAILVAPEYAGPPVYQRGWGGIQPDQIPSRLTDKVNGLQKKGENPLSLTPANPSPVFFTPAAMSYNESSRPLAGLVYGAPVGRYYQLYYFFPLTQVQQTLTLIQRTLMVTGLALVFLFAAIAALVTRWVVAPVRQAAGSAQRLSTGNLGERMPVRGADELAALATSFNDMAESLQDKMNALQDLSQVQRLFVSDVSHELRTPLTTIRWAADFLFESREQFDVNAARSAELLQSQLGRFEALLTDLLEISRYDANVAVLDPEPVDICDLARHAADEAQQLAERRGAKIEFRLPAEPCVAEVDRARVERIMRNLLVNAVEHGEGKDAVVTVAGDSAAVAVAVRDHGIGLAPGEERLVFDRFWRADPARARTTGGTGLGLAIALEDARIHGGWLEAWGERGRGSVFRLTLPRRTGDELAGSPLPLGPDEAEVAALAVTVRLAEGNGSAQLADPIPAIRLAGASGTIRLAGDSGAARATGLTGNGAGIVAAAGGTEPASQGGPGQ
jgi:two-component system sensor histidine kinase MtrB